ncbi:MAG: ATP-binding protein [Rhodospirillales bacterium]|nr:ATP-binding protein [Rhodospirillales bacterium]
MGGNKRIILIALMPGFFVLVAFTFSGLLDPGPATMVGLGFLVGGLWLGQETKRLKPQEKTEKNKPAPNLDNHLLESIPLPVLLLDGSRKVKIANKAAREEFGEATETRDLGYAIRHPEILSAVSDTLSAGTEASFEAVLPGKVERTYLVNVVPVGDIKGKIGNALLTLHDLTIVKVAENLRADFVANVSHELRTPLSALVGFIETLQGEASQDTEAQERFLNIMSAEAGRMTRLIEDLLSLSKIEVNEHVRPNEKVDLESVIEGVVETLDRKAAQKEMSFSIHIPQNLSTIIGDNDEVTQVFTNLIANALNYGEKGTPVTITAKAIEKIPDHMGGGIQVSVEDKGEGITPDHLVRLTERFYRVDKARSRNLGGTGLGLAIVKHIVNRHRGALNIESNVGEGSTFSVLFPCK